jgi:hypothetical protein
MTFLAYLAPFANCFHAWQIGLNRTEATVISQWLAWRTKVDVTKSLSYVRFLQVFH